MASGQFPASRVPITRFSEAESWKLEAEAGSWKPELEAGSWKPKAGSRKLEAES
jgi:hypothetical protein